MPKQHTFVDGQTINEYTITRNGQTVKCYGDWKWDSNCLVIGYEDGEDEYMFEEVYADGGDNWTEVVEILTDWAKRNKREIVELQAC